MSSLAFILPSLPVPRLSRSTFVSRTPLRRPVRTVPPAVYTPVMRKDSSNDPQPSDTYEIKQSEYIEPDTEDDAGDGFIGEADMDDMLGVAMPDDLAGFERREIANSKNKEELVGKLRDIAARRRDILGDKRKGLATDDVRNYLDRL